MDYLNLDIAITGKGDLPDPHGENEQRAMLADIAVEAFQKATGSDDEDAVTDLLTNLMHRCHGRGEDFSAALNMALWHFAAETTDEED
jgi:hypothetical protein